MLDRAIDTTELEKRIKNQNDFDSFSLLKKVLINIQEIILSIGTDETTDIVRKFETSYIRIDGYTDMAIMDGGKLDYKIVLFQLKNSDNYIFRIECRFSTNNGGHKNIVHNYQLIGRKRYDRFKSELHALSRNTRQTEYHNAKASLFYDLSRELSSVPLKDIIYIKI